MEYLLHITTILGIYSILAISMNLILGYTGLLSITHAAFYGIGAYATAVGMRSYDLGLLSTIGIGTLLSLGVAYALGLVLSRFRGDYYMLVTVGFNIIVYNILLNWQSLTRGPFGIPGIPRPEIFGVTLSTTLQYALFVAAITALIYYCSKKIVASSFGRVIQAIREDQDALEVFGYNAHTYKLTVFVIGSVMAALAGSLYAAYIGFIDPKAFVLHESVTILVMVILGGLASIRGSLTGAVIIVLLPELFRFIGFSPELAGQLRFLTYGAMMILFMLYRPQGIFGNVKL